MDTSPDAPDSLLPELNRLDAWAFWIAPGEAFGVDRIVIGTTGSFAILVNQDEGFMRLRMGRIRIGDGPSSSVRGLRGKARKLKEKLSSMAMYGEAEAVICCTSATLGAPRNIKGVWIARSADLPRLIAHRPNSVPRQTAKRAAQNLGAKIRSVRPEGHES